MVSFLVKSLIWPLRPAALRCGSSARGKRKKSHRELSSRQKSPMVPKQKIIIKFIILTKLTRLQRSILKLWQFPEEFLLKIIGDQVFWGFVTYIRCFRKKSTRDFEWSISQKSRPYNASAKNSQNQSKLFIAHFLNVNFGPCFLGVYNSRLSVNYFLHGKGLFGFNRVRVFCNFLHATVMGIFGQNLIKNFLIKIVETRTVFETQKLSGVAWQRVSKTPPLSFNF